MQLLPQALPTTHRPHRQQQPLLLLQACLQRTGLRLLLQSLTWRQQQRLRMSGMLRWRPLGFQLQDTYRQQWDLQC